jgi:hypothetical protein
MLIFMDRDFHKLGLKLKFAYSLCGLVLGLVSVLGGCILFLNGVAGSTQWTFKAFGIAESNVTDAAPGAILFVVGLFVVVFTRFKVKQESVRARPGGGSDTDLLTSDQLDAWPKAKYGN